MGYIQGEGWTQGILFPVVLDELVPADHVRRVIDAFATKLAMTDLGFTRAEAADTGVLDTIHAISCLDAHRRQSGVWLATCMKTH
jgi:hypothetical protein